MVLLQVVDADMVVEEMLLVGDFFVKTHDPSGVLLLSTNEVGHFGQVPPTFSEVFAISVKSSI